MLLLLASPALAAVLTVDPADAGAYATVQAAVDAASAGDEIQLSADRFTECVDVSGKDLTLVGEGAGSTVIDGAGCAAALTATAGEELVVEGLSITSTGPRCVEVAGGALELVDVTLGACGDNTADGPALYAARADLRLSSVEIADVHGRAASASSYGAAAWVEDDDGLAEVELWEVDLQDLASFGLMVEGAASTTIDSSSFDGSIGGLGALWLSSSQVVIRDSTVAGFTNRSGFEDEFSIAALVDVDEAWIEGCTFTDNTTSEKSGHGGVLLLYRVTAAAVLDTAFTNNETVVYSHHDSSHGGALAAVGCGGVGAGLQLPGQLRGGLWRRGLPVGQRPGGRVGLLLRRQR